MSNRINTHFIPNIVQNTILQPKLMQNKQTNPISYSNADSFKISSREFRSQSPFVHSSSYNNKLLTDKFEINNKKNISFSGKKINSFFKKKEVQNVVTPPETFTDYQRNLASNFSKVMDTLDPPITYKSIMSPDEFKKILPSLGPDNFLATTGNIYSGSYCADLDNQTNFSNGHRNIFDILNDVANYSYEYYNKTGKDFIFAITDKDILDSAQHAVRIVATDPEKFAHTKLLPGIQISFDHEVPDSPKEYENSSVLVYGINPYSKNVINFVDKNLQKRKNMIVNFIKQVCRLYPEFAYNVEEFAAQNRLAFQKDFTISGLYWKAREYFDTKGDKTIQNIELTPEEIIADVDDIIDSLGQLYFDLPGKEILTASADYIKTSGVNPSLKNIFKEHSTHYDEKQKKVVSASENLYEDIIECFGNEPQKPVIAIASPMYLSYIFKDSDPDTFYNVLNFIERIQKKSDGMLLAFESVAPNYDDYIMLTSDRIKLFNDFLRQHTGLYEVGGSFNKLKQDKLFKHLKQPGPDDLFG